MNHVVDYIAEMRAEYRVALDRIAFLEARLRTEAGANRLLAMCNERLGAELKAAEAEAARLEGLFRDERNEAMQIRQCSERLTAELRLAEANVRRFKFIDYL